MHPAYEDTLHAKTPSIRRHHAYDECGVYCFQVVRDSVFPSITEPRHNKTNKMICAPSEGSYQTVFAVRMKKPISYPFSFPLSALRRLVRLGGCLGWSESSLSVQTILLVLSSCSSTCLLSSLSMIHLYLHDLLQLFITHSG